MYLYCINWECLNKKINKNYLNIYIFIYDLNKYSEYYIYFIQLK